MANGEQQEKGGLIYRERVAIGWGIIMLVMSFVCLLAAVIQSDLVALYAFIALLVAGGGTILLAIGAAYMRECRDREHFTIDAIAQRLAERAIIDPLQFDSYNLRPVEMLYVESEQPRGYCNELYKIKVVGSGRQICVISGDIPGAAAFADLFVAASRVAGRRPPLADQIKRLRINGEI